MNCLIDREILPTLIVIAGTFQYLTVIASLGVPRVLNWKAEFGALSPLNRHIVWTYAAYILGTNVALATISVLGADWLLDASPLAVAVCLYIALYWGARFLIQILSYRVSGIPKGRRFAFIDWSFRLIFLYLALVFGAALAANL